MRSILNEGQAFIKPQNLIGDRSFSIAGGGGGGGGVGRFWLCHGKIYLIPPKRNPIIHLIGPHLVVNFLESPSLYSVGNE